MKYRNLFMILAIVWIAYLMRNILLNSWGMDFFVLIVRRLWLLLQFLVFVLAVSLLGLRILNENRFDGFGQRWIYAAGLGFGILSYFMFFSGLAGFLRFETVTIFFLISIVAGFSEFRKIFFFITKQIHSSHAMQGFSLFLLGCLVLTAFLYILGAFTPIMDYDAMEYHVGIPDLYARAGQIYPISQNVYSHFPFNTEMLYLAALLIGKTHFIKLLNAFFVLLTCGLIYFEVRKVTSRFEALFAGTVYLCSNHLAIVSWTAKSDAALQFYCAAAFFLALNFKKSGIFLISVFAGLALGAKATAFIFIYGSLSCVIFGKSMEEENGKKAFSRVLFFVLLSSAFVLPYWIKNYLETGDPLFPLAYPFFKSPLWTDAQYEQWKLYHQAKIAGSVPGFFQSFGDSIMRANNFWPTPYLALPAMFFTVRQYGLKWILIYAGVGYGLFYIGTIGDPRFLLPVFPVLAAGTGLALFYARDHIALRKITAGASFILILWNMGSMAVSLEVMKASKYFLGLVSTQEYLREKLSHFAGIEFLNRNMKSGEKVLFLGEARTFYLHREAVAATVFDQPVIIKYFEEKKDLAQTYEEFKSLRINYVLIHPAEIKRWTRGVPGWDGDLSWKQVQDFVSKYARLVYQEARSGISIYKLKAFSDGE